MMIIGAILQAASFSYAQMLVGTYSSIFILPLSILSHTKSLYISACYHWVRKWAECGSFMAYLILVHLMLLPDVHGSSIPR